MVEIVKEDIENCRCDDSRDPSFVTIVNCWKTEDGRIFIVEQIDNKDGKNIHYFGIQEENGDHIAFAKTFNDAVEKVNTVYDIPRRRDISYKGDTLSIKVPRAWRDIDEDISDLIGDLNLAGFRTLGSCSGHRGADEAYVLFSGKLNSGDKEIVEEMLAKFGAYNMNWPKFGDKWKDSNKTLVTFIL